MATLLLLYANINRPDAALYHLPYVGFLNEHKIIFGLNNIHSRFGHISIIQYLSAINYNLLFGLNGISIPLAVVTSIFIIFFYRKILLYHKSKLFNLDFFFCLFISIYIFYKINRYSAYGNDAVTHLLFFYLIRTILIDINFRQLPFLILLCVFIFLNKSTYLFVFLFPIFIYFYNKIYFEYKTTLKLIFSFSGLFLLLWIIKNIIISGCAIYPVHKTCFENLKWAKDIRLIKQDEVSGEAWSKGWPENKNKDLKKKEFNKNFNWISAWITIHGKYVGKILLPYLSLIIILNIYFRNNKKQQKIKNINYYICLIITALLTSIFFLKFPLYRYGYSYLISLIILIGIYNYKKFNTHRVISFTNVILILLPLIFLGKQIQRYNQKYLLDYINKPWPNIYSLSNQQIPNKELKIKFKNLSIFLSTNECAYSNAICTNYNLKKNIHIDERIGYYIISNKDE